MQRWRVMPTKSLGAFGVRGSPCGISDLLQPSSKLSAFGRREHTPNTETTMLRIEILDGSCPTLPFADTVGITVQLELFDRAFELVGCLCGSERHQCCGIGPVCDWAEQSEMFHRHVARFQCRASTRYLRHDFGDTGLIAACSCRRTRRPCNGSTGVTPFRAQPSNQHR